jgi:hypothetical protein
MRHKVFFPLVLALISLESVGVVQGQGFRNYSVLDSLRSITASTTPPSGDLNPYGVAFVPDGFPAGGSIAAGDVLVADFNNSSNLQGTGTTIVSITPNGQQSVFATSNLIGVDTALGVLSSGFVIVGNFPVSYPGGVATLAQGSLQIFNSSGALVMTINDPNLLDSPWGLTVYDRGSQAQVFVSNVVSATVTRLNFSISNGQINLASKVRIGSGYAWQPNAAAVVVGPTGLAYDPNRDTLYVASTDDNKIFAIAEAGAALTSAATNGDAVNSGGTQNELVEFTPQGFLVAQYQIDTGAPGSAFGIASTPSGDGIRFAAVDDNLNTVTVWTVRPGYF